MESRPKNPLPHCQQTDRQFPNDNDFSLFNVITTHIGTPTWQFINYLSSTLINHKSRGVFLSASTRKNIPSMCRASSLRRSRSTPLGGWRRDGVAWPSQHLAAIDGRHGVVTVDWPSKRDDAHWFSIVMLVYPRVYYFRVIGIMMGLYKLYDMNYKP